MIINTKSHPNKQVYKKQFEELLNVDKLSYGIVSETNPKNENSPLWCSVKNGAIQVNKGYAVLKDGNVIQLTNNFTILFDYINNSNKVFYISLKANYLVTERSINEFGETKDKSIEIKNAIVEISEDFDENTSICLGVIKVNKDDFTLIDSNNEHFSNVRPWYSPIDIKHRLILGSGKVTDKNPHGISYNDIDPNNTLHNKLLNRGVVLSKPTRTQDVCGEFKECFINKNEVKFDSDNSLFGMYELISNKYYTLKINYAYFVLPDIPLNIVSLEDKNGNQLVGYSWVEHTSLIKVDISKTKLKDFIVKYYHESSLEPYISNESNGVSVKDVRNNCVIFSEGKSLTEIDKEISFNELENTPSNYSVYVNSKGNYIKVPSLEASNDLETAEGKLSTLFSKSRIEFIIDDLSKDVLKCPVSVNGNGTCSKEVEIYQSFGLYVLDSDKNVVLKNESKVCPEPFKPQIVNGESRVFIKYEKFNQKNIDSQKLEKINFIINDTAYNILFNNRNHSYIYGGIDIDFEFLSSEETDSNIKITISHDKVLIINTSAKSSSLSIHSDFFEEKDCYGEWNVTIESPKKLYVKKFAININFGKIEPIFYSKIDDSYTRLKIIKKDDSICELNPFYGSVVSVSDNKNFNVSINIVGTSNGENINETVEFDSKYRNQDYLNSKLSNNVFDEVFKYSVTNSSTKGKVSIFAYPVGNVSNMCEVFNCNYKNSKISKLYDSRKVCPNIMYENKNILGKVFDYVNSISSFITNSIRKNYFELKNIHNSSIDVTLYSKTSFYIDIVENNKAKNFISCIRESNAYKIQVTLEKGYSLRSYNQDIRDLTPIIVDDSVQTEIVHWDNSWSTLENLCSSMKSLTKIPNSWDGCSNIVSLKNAFRNSKLESIPNNWNGLGRVTTMYGAFENSKITYIPNFWNGLDKVTDIRHCFEGCVNLKISELNFIGLRLEEVEYAFFNTIIEKITSFEGLNLVKNISYMFANSNLSEVPLNWSYLENVEYAISTFENCKLSDIPKSWYGLNKVENMQAMFKNCTLLEYIPISWIGLDSVKSIKELFYNCSSVKDGGYEDVESLINIEIFDDAFYGMTSWKVDADEIYDMLRNIAEENND